MLVNSTRSLSHVFQRVGVITTIQRKIGTGQIICRGKSIEKSDKKMPRGVKKEHLPSKICLMCNRPFTWRKKWENCWDEVQTCSERCRNERRKRKNAENRQRRQSQHDDDDDDE
eukprot:TRINITY_DN736_c0_g2_i2.p5 TRINITY_DN736_c0_g2~~TRINITY_DN736_c0_g2_i2.p5  ORF type:complete len:114 (+),score=8.73 TRINITY_DN736_c0_g2_i2:254-595(+)